MNIYQNFGICINFVTQMEEIYTEADLLKMCEEGDNRVLV